ncbi:DUF6356 family protein [Ramlibacter sp.]|uniref:DUF6356 family protein n=1 Tax=Ramlibacter sp. TaxID=1917967 RepID=UPI0018568957|nr:DUF6356 family protein [Ramlibacter sp.]MBA2675926.1 hypothetical protein [Ramlibacter sp.]
MKQLQRAFVDHPQSVGESYWQHMRASLSFAGPLLLGGFAALVHAVFPFLLTGTGSGIVARLYERMVRNRGNCAKQCATR